MGTSLLFQKLRRSGSPALEELEKALNHEHRDSQRGSESADESSRSNAAHIHERSPPSACLACCILSHSHAIAPPPYRYVEPKSNRRDDAKRDDSRILSVNGDADVCSRVSADTNEHTFAIDCASLASAAFPRLSPLLHELWEQCNSTSWLEHPPKAEEVAVAAGNSVVWVEKWWLRPDEEFSSQLRLWGNAAVSRRHYAAAEALYAAALSLFPNCSSSSSSSRLAVLHANRSLSLLQLGRVAAALRAATEAVARDPSYLKAWHRRAASLKCLLDTLEERVRCINGSSRDSCRGFNLVDFQRFCIQQVESELAEARRMLQPGVTAAAAAAAAKKMVVGRCGCEASVSQGALIDSSNAHTWLSASDCWLRGDTRLKESEKGWGLVCGWGREGASREDASLVLEEDAFALHVHPKMCAATHKLPLSPQAAAQQLHASQAVRLAWEEQIEAVPGPLKPAEDAEGGHLQQIRDGAEGVCAGCAVLPARLEAAAAGGPPWSAEASHAFAQQLLTPTLPTVPCGFCAGALFCCEACRYASSHLQVCRQQQQQEGGPPHRQGSGQGPSRGTSSGGAAHAEVAATRAEREALVQPLAVALEEPHRQIARQLLNAILPAATEQPAEPHHGGGGLSSSPAAAVSPRRSLLQGPAWLRVLTKAAHTVVDCMRIIDWLLNASWLAGQAIDSTGKRICCGGRCLICSPPTARLLAPSQRAAAAPAAAGAAAAAAGGQRCGRCCVCCKAWCVDCSASALVSRGSGPSRDSLLSIPLCVFAAALHAYGVACCNSFTIRVACDPEEEAAKVGTAFFLTASLLNHSCVPNAVVVFGEPRLNPKQQQQDRRSHHQTAMGPLSHEGGGLLGGPEGPPPAAGRGALLQLRLCGWGSGRDGQGSEREMLISYGPMVGLEESSWGHRQEWLLRNAGFYCHCEACVLPEPHESAGSVGTGAIDFNHELLCGFPCPVCSVEPRVVSLLEAERERSLIMRERDVLSNLVALLTPYLSSRLGCQPNGRPKSQFAGLPLGCEIPSETTQLVAGLAQILIKDSPRKELRQQWTTTRSLALLGHSGVRLWMRAPHSCSEPSAASSSFLSSGLPVFVCNEFRCLECGALFPVATVGKQAYPAARLNRLRSLLDGLEAPLGRVSDKTKCEALAKRVFQETLQLIPAAVSTDGCLSIAVWQVLQTAARAAHALSRLQTEAKASAEFAFAAGTCLCAGVRLLLQRLPVGLALQEVCTQIYKAALLYGRAGDFTQAKELLRAALKATQDSCGLHSVSLCCMKDYLQWMELPHV